MTGTDQPLYSLTLPSQDPDSPPARANVYSFEGWAREYRGSGPERQEQMEALVSGGTVHRRRDEVVLDGRDLIVLRQRLARVMQGRDHTNYWDEQTPEAAPVRFLLDGLWPWGTCPSLAGQYGSGKTRLLVNLLRALVDPTVRFLGTFGPTTLTEEEMGRTIEYLNCETPAELFEEELRRVGLDRDSEGFWGVPGQERSHSIRVRHLEQEGGADIFDITDPVIFDDWVFRLTYCESCEGRDPGDDVSPVLLIVDTMTAVLGDADKDSSDYGAFIAAFHRLLRVCDIPNGLTVGHSYGTTARLLGSPENMTRQDGRWSYMSDDAENPLATRRFKVQPRSTAPRVLSTPVVEGADGLLYLSEPERPAPREQPAGGEEEPFTRQHLDAVRSRLASAPPKGLRKTEVTGRGREGTSLRAALNHLIETGEVSVSQVSGVQMCTRVTNGPG
jgi:hypothetical protein